MIPVNCTRVILCLLIACWTVSAQQVPVQPVSPDGGVVSSMLSDQLEGYDDFPVRLGTLEEGGTDPGRRTGEMEIRNGNACLYRGQWSCASRHFRQALFFNQSSVSAWRGLLVALAADNDLHDLILESKRCNQLLSERALGWLFLIYAYDHLNLSEEADLAYSRYHGEGSIGSDESSTLVNTDGLDQTWEEQLLSDSSGRYGAAVTGVADQLSSEYPVLFSLSPLSDASVWDSVLNNSSDLLQETGFSDSEMEAEFERVTGRSYDDYLDWFAEGISLYMLGRYDEAEEVFHSIREDPGISRYLSDVIIPILLTGGSQEDTLMNPQNSFE